MADVTGRTNVALDGLDTAARVTSGAMDDLIGTSSAAAAAQADVAKSAIDLDFALRGTVGAADAASGALTMVEVSSGGAAGELDKLTVAATAASDAQGKVAADGLALDASVNTLRATVDVLNGSLIAQAGAADLAAASLGRVALAADAAAAAQGRASAATAATVGVNAAASASIQKVTNSYHGFWGILGLFRKEVPLFGGIFGDMMPGILSMVKGWHIALDAAIEFGAVWIPLIIGVGVYSLIAAKAVDQLATQLHNMNTVVDSTAGEAAKLGPLTGGFQKLQAVVSPTVFDLFGDAMNVVNTRAGTLVPVLRNMSEVFDQLGARITMALESAGASTFMAGAVNDLRQVGNAFGDLFGIIGNLMKAVPGYAEILLAFGSGVLNVVEHLTSMLEPVIAVGLAMHGFILWVGLAVTLVMALGGPLVAAATAVKLFGLSVIALGGEMLGAAASGDLFAAAMMLIEATGGPIVWIAAAVAGLVALVVWLASAKSATQQWGDSMQKALQQQQTLGTQLLTSDLTQVTEQYTAAQQKLSQTTEFQNVVNAHTGEITKGVTAAYSAQETVVSQLFGVQQQLSGEQTLYNSRVSALAKTYGGTTAAIALLNDSGVTMSQMLNGNSDAWKSIQTQVAGAYAGFKTMGTQSGVLGQDLLAMGRQTTTAGNASASAVQAVNTAWSDFVTNMTGSETGFDTLEQSMNTLQTDSKKVGASFDGLNANSLTMNNDFETAITNVNGLIGTFRTAGLATNVQTQAIKDSIAPLEKFTDGNQAAVAQLVGLAQEAGYTGPASLQTLNKWLGNTTNGTTYLKNAVNQATIQEALLSTAMRNQGTYISNELIGDINQAILKYDGVQKAATAYGNAIAHGDAQTAAGHAARQTLIDDLIKSGNAAHESQGQIAAMIAKVLGIPPKAALQIVMTGEGQYTIGPYPTPGGKAPPLKLGELPTGATGMRIPGYGGGDIVHAMLEPGETVVPKHLTPAVAPLMRKHRVPGFAGGGLVEAGNTDVLSGQYAVNMYDNFKGQFTEAMVAAMQGAVAAAATAAAAAGPGGGSASSNAALARQLMPSWGSGAMWTAWNNVAMAESGWNQFARNPSSGAYGIPQALPPSKMGAAANPPESNPTAQIRWMISYIQCMPLDTEILTRRGWVRYDEIREGDETIGYNPRTGRSEWTPIVGVSACEGAPLVRLRNKTWDVTCTPNHRWSTRHVKQDDPRRSVAGQKVRTTASRSWHADELTRTSDLTSRHSIRLAAASDTGDGPVISIDEAELLGWVMGDGSVSWLKSRTPESTHWRTTAGCTSVQIKLVQGTAKPEHVARIDELTRPLLASRQEYAARKPGGADTTMVRWLLPRPYSRELLKRSGYDHTDPVAFVLSLNAEQRKAFLRGVFGAEGYQVPDGTVNGRPARGHQIYSQADGPQQDAIVLALYLDGYRPSMHRWSDASRRGLGSRDGANIGQTKPFVSAARTRREDAGHGSVWCPTTGLGTWTARQGAQVFLTGNSVYGTPVGAWAHENSNHWYGKGGLVSFDSGGWLMPGLTMAVNNTGKPEQVTAGSKEDRGRLENVEKLLGQLINATQANAPQANADALQKALDGVAKRSAYKGQYTTRRNALRS
jgi:hypothetical protein